MRILNSDEAVALCTGVRDGRVGCGTRVVLVYEDVFTKIAQRGRQYFRCPKCGLLSPLNYQIPAPVPEGKLPEPEPTTSPPAPSPIVPRTFWGFVESVRTSWNQPTGELTYLFSTLDAAKKARASCLESLKSIVRVGDDQDYTTYSPVGEFRVPLEALPPGSGDWKTIRVYRSLLEYAVT